MSVRVDANLDSPEAVEAVVGLLHDYPQRIIVAFDEDELVELQRICREPNYESDPAVRKRLHKRMKTAQMEAFTRQVE